MYAVGTRTMSLLVLLILVPVFLIALAVFGVLLLWRHLRKKDARRKGEQAENAGSPVPSAAEETAPPANRSLSEVLKAHRLRCGLTQESVAEALDVSRQAVSKWETGTAEPTAANMLALARLYGVSAEELLQAAAGE